MALTTTIDLSLESILSVVKDLSNIPKSTLQYRERVSLASGVAAGQADRLWYDERTLAASTNEDLDLVGTTLLDDFGTAFSVARVKFLSVKALAGNTNNVIVGAAAATQWAAFLGATGTMTLRPGSSVWLAAGAADATGYVSAAGATDLLRVANGAAGSSVTYQIVVIGASA